MWGADGGKEGQTRPGPARHRCPPLAGPALLLLYTSCWAWRGGTPHVQEGRSRSRLPLSDPSLVPGVDAGKCSMMQEEDRQDSANELGSKFKTTEIFFWTTSHIGLRSDMTGLCTRAQPNTSRTYGPGTDTCVGGGRSTSLSR